MPRFQLYWAPEGKPIGVVCAKDARSARRMAPRPYRRYLGEIGVELIRSVNVRDAFNALRTSGLMSDTSSLPEDPATDSE